MTSHNVTPPAVDKPEPKPDLARDSLCVRLQDVARRIGQRNHSASQLHRLDEAVTALERML